MFHNLMLALFGAYLYIYLCNSFIFFNTHNLNSNTINILKQNLRKNTNIFRNVQLADIDNNNIGANAMDWDLKLISPCKLNLFLRILGRRANGYHDLASLFQTISLSDEIYFSKLTDENATCDEMICSDTTLTVDKDNLVIKALELMRNKTNIKQYFKIYLHKVVPMQAGLGGGSGNAATCMHAFNRLCGYPCTTEQLLEWSGDIGSDISFFFSSGTAYCTGRGEIVQSLDPLPHAQDVEVHVFKPDQGLSTALVFKSLQLDQCSKVIPESILDCYVNHGAISSAENHQLINDLELPAFQNAPLLKSIKHYLVDNYVKSGVLSGVMMSGSGTSIYALRNKSTSNVNNNKSQEVFHEDQILALYPNLKHFKCNFIQKANDIYSWYE